MGVVRLAVVALAAAVVTGCAGRGPSKPAVEPSVVAAQPGAVAPVALTSLLQNRLRLDGGPDLMAVGTDAVWVKSDDGRLRRVDPRTDKVMATVQAASRLCQGLGVAGDQVWVCTDDGIARVDPTSNTLVQRAPVGRVADQATMPISHGHVWVLPADGRTLYGVATADGSVDVRVALPAACFGAAATASEVWLSCRPASLVLAVDPEAGRVTKRVTTLAAPTMITAVDAVWVAYQGGVARVDAESGRVTRAVRITTEQGMVHATPDALWVRAARAFVRELDPTTLALRREVRSDETAGGSVAVGFDSIWASVFDNTNGSVYRLRA